jgi:hypothetical protein
MLARLGFAFLVLALMAGASAQTPVRTETFRPPQNFGKFKADGRLIPPGAQGNASEIIADLSLLPPAVARTRDRILAAARSGNLQGLAAIVQADETTFSRSDERDPAAFWRANYPDSEGLEALSILTTILETPFVHADRGTQQEVYLWPYFARVPLKTLSREQNVALFKIVTGGDYKDMLAFGTYAFFRVGISPDGTCQFFVTGRQPSDP